MKQRDAVFQAVVNVMGEQDGKYEPTTEQRKNIINIVTEGLQSGDVAFSESAQAKYNTEEKIRGYASGLVSNWLRKDPELNGGVKYTPKNPGSRTGSQDEQVKAIRALIKSGQLDEEGMEAAEQALNDRLAELRAAKVEKSIDFDALPEHLIEQLNLKH